MLTPSTHCAALERAERECLEDAEARALRREREAERRARLDVEYVGEFARRLKSRYPSCPAGEVEVVSEAVSSRGAGGSRDMKGGCFYWA